MVRKGCLLEIAKHALDTIINTGCTSVQTADDPNHEVAARFSLPGTTVTAERAVLPTSPDRAAATGLASRFRPISIVLEHQVGRRPHQPCFTGGLAAVLSSLVESRLPGLTTTLATTSHSASTMIRGLGGPLSYLALAAARSTMRMYTQTISSCNNSIMGQIPGYRVLD